MAFAPLFSAVQYASQQKLALKLGQILHLFVGKTERSKSSHLHQTQAIAPAISLDSSWAAKPMQWPLRASPLFPSPQTAIIPGSARRPPQQDTKCHAEPLAFAAFHFALAASSGAATRGRAAGGAAHGWRPSGGETGRNSSEHAGCFRMQGPDVRLTASILPQVKVRGLFCFWFLWGAWFLQGAEGITALPAHTYIS